MKNKRVGRPSVWHKPIMSYVEEHGIVRARDIRIALGVSERSLYNALNVLVAGGALSWCEASGKNYRFIKKSRSMPRLDFLLRSHN